MTKMNPDASPYNYVHAFGDSGMRNIRIKQNTFKRRAAKQAKEEREMFIAARLADEHQLAQISINVALSCLTV